MGGDSTMGDHPARRGLTRAPLLVTALAAILTISILPAHADGGPDAAMVDSLWNHPQGIRPDSGWYFLQAGWDQAGLILTRDPEQRGLTELSMANADLLNAYSLLAEARTDPGPHPVPLLDPVLSNVYAAISGVHIKAPLGSVFGALNQAMLNIEGRGSTQDITESLLRDYAQHERAAERDLAQSRPLDSLWAANSLREQAMLAKLQTLGGDGANAMTLTAAVKKVDSERQSLLEQRATRARGQTQSGGDDHYGSHNDGSGGNVQKP